MKKFDAARMQSEAERVIRDYGAMIYRVCYVRLAPVDPSLADDAYQNVFLYWLEHTPETEPGSEHEKAWFLRCAVHRCTDIYRSRQKHAWDEISESVPSPPCETTEVMDAILALEEKYRMPLYLHCVCGFTQEECTKALDLTSSAFRTRLTRGRRALAAVLGLDIYEKKEAEDKLAKGENL